MLVRNQSWFDEENVDVRVETRAVRIDLERKVFHAEPALGDGDPFEVPYDQLLLATGSTPRVLDMGADVGPISSLRSVEDSVALRSSLKAGARVAIVGGGWIGLEVAAAARLSGAEVTVFEAGELPLVRVLGTEVATVFAALHRGHGVDLRLGSQPTAAD